MSERRSNDAAGAGPAGDAQPAAPAAPRAMSDEDVARLWEEFKLGNVARCPRDEAPLALAVDGAAKAYRLVCTRCGNASLWFEVAPTGLSVRPSDEPPGGPGASDD